MLQSLQGHLEEVKGLLGEPQEVTVASLDGLGSLSDWWQVFRVTQVCCILLLLLSYPILMTHSKGRILKSRMCECLTAFEA